MTKKKVLKVPGFSLIEILVVLAIMGILLSFIVPSVMNRPDEAKVLRAKNDINVLESALLLYKLDQGDFPSSTQGLQTLVEKKYIKSLPTDPWGEEYRYDNPGLRSEFDIYSYGADKKEGGEGKNQDIGNWLEDQN